MKKGRIEWSSLYVYCVLHEPSHNTGHALQVEDFSKKRRLQGQNFGNLYIILFSFGHNHADPRYKDVSVQKIWIRKQLLTTSIPIVAVLLIAASAISKLFIFPLPATVERKYNFFPHNHISDFIHCGCVFLCRIFWILLFTKGQCHEKGRKMSILFPNVDTMEPACCLVSIGWKWLYFSKPNMQESLTIV